jgi:hypothetical protein
VTAATPPAGWYADPSGGAAFRWWDGTTWTDSTSPGAAVPPSAAPPAGPAYGSAGEAPYTPTGTPSPFPYGGQPGSAAPVGQTFGQPYQPDLARSPYQRAALAPAVGWRRNQYAFWTLGIAAVYVVIAVFAGFVFIGILPVLYAFRSMQRREPLFPLAIVGAALAVIVAFTTLS